MRKSILLMLALAAHANAADVIPANRETNWQGTAGVQPSAGPYYSETFIPTRPTMSGTPIPTSASVGTINAAIAACPSGQHVKLAAGTFNNLSGNIVLKSNVTLRGSGGPWDASPTKTILSFSARGSQGHQGGVFVILDGTGAGAGLPVPYHPNWTSGYAKGSTSLTLSDVSGFSIGQLVVLDQNNDPTYIAGGSQGATVSGQSVNRLQHEVHEVTNISGNTLTISPGVYMPNWSATFSPQVWPVTTNKMVYAGLEDLVIDGQPTGGSSVSGAHNIELWYTQNCWIKNVESSYGHAQNIMVRYCNNLEIRHCYLHHGAGSGSGNYGIENWSAVQSLIEDNTLILISSQIVLNDSHGCVTGYNYVFGAVWSDLTWLPQEIALNHDAHSAYNLYEGNITSKAYSDFIHGSASHQTLFRNRSTGLEPGRTDGTHAVNIERYNRSYNLVGNVLGTAGYHSTYEILGGGVEDSQAVFKLGFFSTGNSGPADPVVWTSMIRHGNWDPATDASDGAGNGIRWETSNANVTDFTDHNIPNSLYRTAKPFWFGSLIWPPISPTSPGTITPESIPAGYRYVNGSDPPTGPTPTPTPTPTPSAPVVTTHPASISIMEGQTPTFAVTIASGGGQVTYQWQKNTVNVGTPTTTGAISNTYLAPPATLADNGSNFRCVISNAIGSTTSNAAILTVTTACPAGISHALESAWSALEGEIAAPFQSVDAAEDYIVHTSDVSDPLLGGKARYCVTIPNPANSTGYKLSMKVDCVDGGSNSLYVAFDAEPNVNTGIWSIPVTIGLEWRDVFFAPPGPTGNPYIFMLPPGRHELIVRGREADVKISQLKLEANPVPSPTPTPTATPAASIPTFIPNGANAITSQVVTMDTSLRTGSPVIKFTINGIDPAVADPGDIITYNGTSYTVDHSLTIKARTSATGFVDSPMATSLPYNITVATPILTSSTGSFTATGMLSVTISDTTPSSTWYWSKDGSSPTNVYGVPVLINSSCTFKAQAKKVGLTDSAIVTQAITINAPSPTPTPTPTATPTPTPTVTPFPPTGSTWLD